MGVKSAKFLTRHVKSTPEPQRLRGAEDLAMMLYHGSVDEENGYDGYFESNFIAKHGGRGGGKGERGGARTRLG